MQPGTVGNAETRALAAGFVFQDDLRVAGHHDQPPVGGLHDIPVRDRDDRIDTRFHAGLFRAALRRAADMECPHRQLGARFADRLGSDNADRLADIDRRAAGEIAAVATGADAVARLAGQCRAHLHHVDAGILDRVGLLFADKLPVRDQNGLVGRMEDIALRCPAEQAFRQRDDDISAFDDRAEIDAPVGAAILFVDDAVLSHVDQTPGQITGICRLQCRIRQALASTVCRVEIFEDRKPFLEVGNDRRLDDLARRLGHQAAHSGKLLDLRRRAPGT